MQQRRHIENQFNLYTQKKFYFWKEWMPKRFLSCPLLLPRPCFDLNCDKKLIIWWELEFWLHFQFIVHLLCTDSSESNYVARKISLYCLYMCWVVGYTTISQYQWLVEWVALVSDQVAGTSYGGHWWTGCTACWHSLLCSIPLSPCLASQVTAAANRNSLVCLMCQICLTKRVCLFYLIQR